MRPGDEQNPAPLAGGNRAKYDFGRSKPDQSKPQAQQSPEAAFAQRWATLQRMADELGLWLLPFNMGTADEPRIRFTLYFGRHVISESDDLTIIEKMLFERHLRRFSETEDR